MMRDDMMIAMSKLNKLSNVVEEIEAEYVRLQYKELTESFSDKEQIQLEVYSHLMDMYRR